MDSKLFFRQSELVMSVMLSNSQYQMVATSLMIDIDVREDVLGASESILRTTTDLLQFC